MDFLPKASGTRPRVACEITPQSVAAARSDVPGAPLDAVACVTLGEGAVAPGLKPGNLADRVAIVAALRKALEQVGARPNARNADVTLVVPDGACRVLLLDFDSLPNKLSEALPLVRFRLKKLVPFEADDAMVSFQIMSQSRQAVRVLAVAMPRDVLAEYESAVREAGFEPGAVLPSTLATMAGIDETSAALVVNANPLAVTTAIACEGILLLHRTVDLQREPAGVPANVPPALLEPSPDPYTALPLVDADDSAQEWAAQQPLPEHGRDPYGVHAHTPAAVQDQAGFSRDVLPDIYAAGEPATVQSSPYNGPTVRADLYPELHYSSLIAPTSPGTLTDPALAGAGEHVLPLGEPQAPASLPPADFGAEVAQAVSVAVAYFEDNVGSLPRTVLSAGSLGASGLEHILEQAGLVETDALRVREVVEASALAAGSVSARVPRGVLAGVMGALRS